MFRPSENFKTPSEESSVDSVVLHVSPPPTAFFGNARPDDTWVHDQEQLLNEKYPGKNLLLEYHSHDHKMHVVQNKGYDGPTMPLDEWEASQK